jgi:hypothetical protein
MDPDGLVELLLAHQSSERPKQSTHLVLEDHDPTPLELAVIRTSARVTRSVRSSVVRRWADCQLVEEVSLVPVLLDRLAVWAGTFPQL